MIEQRIVRISRILLFTLLLHIFALAGFAQNPRQFEDILISTPKPYDRVVAGIEALGGKVRYQFDFVDGISVSVPVDALDDVRRLVGQSIVEKDGVVPHPLIAATGHDVTSNALVSESPKHKAGAVRGGSPVMDSSAETSHGNPYVLNFDGSDIDKVHALGYTGKGGVTAVIDTGIRPGFAALGNSVVGGIDFVGDGNGFSNVNNDGHGTFVATLISGKAKFDLSTNPTMLQAMMAHAPEALTNGSTVTLLGSAPGTKIYVVRVFGKNTDAGSRVSTIVAAIQHVIEKKHSGMNIQVCNLSLGKSTFQAGRDLLDKAVDALLKEGIVPVVSAGDAGTATLTIGSPGSSLSAITVGAANFARNERILRDVQEGTGVGVMWRPTTGTQTAYFSSRGPNADGRVDPDVIASGFGSISQGYDATTELSLASGTSFSAPIVSGVVAILRQAFPKATATQIRNAIIASADDSVLADGSTELDQGHGLVNAKAAYDLLKNGTVSDELPDFNAPTFDVRSNVQINTDLVVRDGSVSEQIRELRPGQRKDLLYNVAQGTKQVVVVLNRFDASLPKKSQNALFGDDILLSIHTAKTSAFGQTGDYKVNTFTTGGRFTIPNPEPGILRVSLAADWSNVGTVSTDVSVTSTLDKPQPSITAGPIAQSQIIVMPIEIPQNVTNADFTLSWNYGWNRYPTNDLDLVLIDPSGNRDTSGATFNSPETTSLKNPQAGTWQVLIEGFEVPTGTDDFTLKVTFNSKPVN